MVKSRRKNLEQLADLLVNGLTVPVDSVVSLSGVTAGLEKLKTGHVLGRVVVDVMAG